MDTGRDVAEAELGKVAVHDRKSSVTSQNSNTFERINKDFNVDFEDDRADLDDDPVAPHRKRQLTLASACILGNELCERLAYYGLQTNMGLYLKKVMGYPADTASQLLQVWKGTVYLTPLLGAYLADAVLGRFWVILIFSTIYFLGMLGITLVNIIPAIKPSKTALPPAGIDTSRAVFWAFMYLTALGSGGIKPCVSSFGGDQFKETSARERSWRSSFFNFFYASINIGSLVAATVVVGVQESKGYGVGFAIPTIAFGVAILAFIVGAVCRLYVKYPPGGSPFTRIWRVFRGGFANRKLAARPPAELYQPPPGVDGHLPFVMAHTPRMKWLDKAAIAPSETKVGKNGKAARIATLTEVEETKAFLAIMPLFLCVCIYQMAYDPIFTLLPYPGDVMDRSMGKFQIPASSISFANTFGVLFTIVFYDLVLVPITKKLNRPISMTLRIGIGFIIQIVALISAALIEMARYRMVRSTGLVQKFVDAGPKADPLDPAFVEPMSIWWQFIPYFLVGASEAFTNVGVMELFYSQVSEAMRSLSTSVYLLTMAIGTYLASALNIIIAAASPHDLWVAENPLYGHYDWYFWLNAGILAAGLVAYVFVARGFVEKPIVNSNQDPFKRDTRLHSELANVSRVWPSISHSNRMSELRMRSTASKSSAASMRRGSVVSVDEKADVLGSMMTHDAARGGPRPVAKLDTVYSEALEAQDSARIDDRV